MVLAWQVGRQGVKLGNWKVKLGSWNERSFLPWKEDVPTTHYGDD